MPISLPANVNTTPSDEMLYLGLSRQDLKFHQALGELIDNAVSASSGTNRFDVEVHLEKVGETIRLTVIDNGSGISFSDLQGKVLRIGGKGSKAGRLNEHGFGLKNALCVLTQNTRPFHVITRDDATKNEGLYLKVIGPFRSEPPMEIVSTSESEWLKDITCQVAETGTRVYAETTMHYLRSLYRGRAGFETLAERLLEHLGVMYRGYLEGTINQIMLRWRDASNGVVPWTDWRVGPIVVPFEKASEETLEINNAGKTHKVKYKWGTLDRGAIEDSSKGKPYPLKMYYQGNQQTQGIDIRVRGRVILPHQITYLWPDRQPHNDLNHFIGELIIEDAAFSTVNNKIELDPNNPAWESLSNKLQDEKYRPFGNSGIVRSEAEIQNDLKAKLGNVVPGSSVQDKVSTWEAVGVEIDLVHTMSNGDEHIYELKAGTAKPLDVYQLIMYWDARVEAGLQPKLGRLVAKASNQRVDRLIEYWNKRKDRSGHPYNLEFKTVSQLL